MPRRPDRVWVSGQLGNFRAELERLGAEVDAAKRSKALTEYLDTCARFWRYSPFSQMPPASSASASRSCRADLVRSVAPRAA